MGSSMMWTLTVDPDLFPDGPQAAYHHVTSRSGVARFVAALDEAGFLNSSRWFACFETQQNGWPHWHVIIDSAFVPFQFAAETWARVNWRRSWGKMPAVDTRQGSGRPVFGSIKFRARGGPAVVSYTVKYLTKPPRDGVPSWVLDSPTSVKRFSRSRNFWQVTAGWDNSEPSLDAWRDYRTGRDEWDSIERQVSVELELEPSPSGPTARERIAGCGGRSVVFREVELSDGSFAWQFYASVEGTDYGQQAVWRGCLTFVSVQDQDDDGFYISAAADVEMLDWLIRQRGGFMADQGVQSE